MGWPKGPFLLLLLLLLCFLQPAALAVAPTLSHKHGELPWPQEGPERCLIGETPGPGGPRSPGGGPREKEGPSKAPRSRPAAATACPDLACFADHLQLLTCTWGGGGGGRRRAPANLTATWDCGGGGSCAFRPDGSHGEAAAPRWTCRADQTLCFGNNRFHVEASGPAPARRRCGKSSFFHDHLRPSPPFNLTAAPASSSSPEGGDFFYTVSWATPYGGFHHLHGQLQYELAYRRRGQPWPEPSQKRLLQDARILRLLPREFDGGAEYELRVRAGPRGGSPYQGTWSDWSPPAPLTTMPQSSGPGGALWLLLLLLSLFPALLALLGCHQRLWKKLDLFIPSPAPFFQPLFLAHNGDFKRWVGAPSAEWKAAGPEVCQKTGITCLPPHPAGGKDGPAALPEDAPPSFLLSSGGDEEEELQKMPLPEQPYGHLSIETVRVAGGLPPCCPQCGCAAEEEEETEEDGEGVANGGACQGLLLEGVHHDPLFLAHLFPGTRGESWMESLLGEAPVQTGGCLGRRRLAEGGGPWMGGLSSPRVKKPPRYGEPLSPERGAEGDLGTSLDLDTLDSGFADGDCESPTEAEGGGRQGGEEEEEEEGEAFLASYVQQWVSCHTLKA